MYVFRRSVKYFMLLALKHLITGWNL